ncbi:MAG TPA: dual specificity protein phosphatase family protein [Acidobacteriota bacterium]|nr:dual specificity protein phosphatase family protein [Acidobacteriota bacterium]
MDIVQIDVAGRLFLSPAIDDWDPIEKKEITFVIDLEGDLDLGIPTIPNHMLYVYFPIFDEDLPDLRRLHAIARMGASLVDGGYKVLAHCGMGLNRSALMAGLILVYLGMDGKDAVRLLREKRPGALFNENFASYLETLRDSRDLLKSRQQGAKKRGRKIQR